MAFITEEEAKKRLTSGDNLLVRLNRVDSTIKPVGDLPEIVPDIYDDQEDDTIPTENDPVRQAVLQARRQTLSSKHRGGKYPGQKNIPPVFRALIGAAARVGTTKSAAQAFGVSQLTANNYKNGKTSNIGEPNPTLLEQIEENTLGIRNQVLGILSYTVAGITPESLENKDPKELSIIARNLSAIMSSTKPPADFGDKTTNAQVIVFSPEQEQEAAYDTVNVG